MSEASRLELVEPTRARIEKLLAEEESQRVPDDAFVDSYKRELRTLAEHTTRTEGSMGVDKQLCVVDSEPVPCSALRHVLEMYM